MKTKIIFCCLLGLISCNVTLAQGYDFYSPWGCGWGYFNQPWLDSSGYIPYYALHPPVYYSYRIDARSYGDSPFPYPPGFSALQAYSSVQPQIIKNEHVDEAGPPSDQYQTHAPLRIPNPYVEQSGDAGMSKGAKWENKKIPKPLVVYPAVIARTTR
ncbi:MAG: hypothetical protein ABSG67_16160 [Thermoguttaceae bacterium]